MTETKGRPDGQVTPSVKADKAKERAAERALFVRYSKNPDDSILEGQIVEQFRPLVYRIVHKFNFQSDQFDDLVQVGLIGLLHAIRRFDPTKEFRFSTFAWQTIQGEIQRYFRDKTWAVNVPRDLKERSLRVFNAKEELAIAAGHDPTVAEIAIKTGLSDEQVQEAMELGSAYHPQSFSYQGGDGDVSYSVIDRNGSKNTQGMASTKRSIFWENLLGQLDEAEATVVRMYYFQQCTQKEIAEELCTSQMNVSRLMRKAQAKLRRMIVPADVENLSTL